VLVNRARLVGALSAASIAVAGLIIATPASADPVPGYDCVVDTPNPGANPQIQPIQVCASFDKASYGSGDVVKATVSVKNLGSAPAPDVTIWDLNITGSDHLIGNPVGPLITYGAMGPKLAPGDTIVSEVDGYAANPASGLVTFTAPVMQFVNGGGQPFGPSVSITSSVTPATGDYSGVVFADGNGNNSPDPGEGMAGVQVTLSGPFQGINGSSAQTYTATSDANGDVDLTGLPAGQYSASASSPSGWYIQPANGGSVTVGTTASGPDLYEATPAPVPLKASMTFDQSSYHAGDTANVTVSLTNTSSTTLYGVDDECDPPAEDGELLGVGNGWDQLRSPGITVPADQTVTLDLSEVVPVEEATDITKKYAADCLFGPYTGYRSDSVQASAVAAILPPDIPTTDFVVNVINDDPTGGTSTPSFHLLDPASQDVVAGGFFGFKSGETIPVGQGIWNIALSSGYFGASYWQLAPGQPTTLDTSTITPGQTVEIHVLPLTQLAPPAPPAS
jgi:hypothetical protein